jgi:hypothetical protein
MGKNLSRRPEFVREKAYDERKEDLADYGLLSLLTSTADVLTDCSNFHTF